MFNSLFFQTCFFVLFCSVPFAMAQTPQKHLARTLQESIQQTLQTSQDTLFHERKRSLTDLYDKLRIAANARAILRASKAFQHYLNRLQNKKILDSKVLVELDKRLQELKELADNVVTSTLQGSWEPFSSKRQKALPLSLPISKKEDISFAVESLEAFGSGKEMFTYYRMLQLIADSKTKKMETSSLLQLKALLTQLSREKKMFQFFAKQHPTFSLNFKLLSFHSSLLLRCGISFFRWRKQMVPKDREIAQKNMEKAFQMASTYLTQANSSFPTFWKKASNE